tara:strand:+ start:37113 stop:37226 length:114 start_codon:yes stop_codon:yes gene_type:complete
MIQQRTTLCIFDRERPFFESFFAKGTFAEKGWSTGRS